MDAKIMKYVPKSKREAISDCYRDDDGMWICLKEGWNADRMDSVCRVIHEDYIKDLRYQIAGIHRLEDSIYESNRKLASMKPHYTGKYNIGDTVTHRGHECKIIDVWEDDGLNGITIEPTGDYGFPVDIFEKDLVN